MIPLPVDFINRIQEDSFIDDNLLRALNDPSPTSVRLHPLRQASFDQDSKIPWNSDGIYLEKRPAFTYDPLFHAGAYYPQEAGSMYLQQVLKTLELPENPVVLDLSAAPGGKSTLIASFLAHKGVLLANEINRSRAYILSENLSKWGYANTFVCNHKPSDLKELKGQIDVLVVDAPCSGEGMFRKDLNSRSEWNLTNARICEERQEEILEHVWPLLKQGGTLIYSTCTFNPGENEAQLAPLLESGEALKIELPYYEGLTLDRMQLGYYFFPDKIRSEGFYIAALQKNTPSHTKGKPKKQGLKIGLPPSLKDNVASKEELMFWQEDEQVFASTPFAVAFYSEHTHLSYLKTGLHVASFQKKTFIPAYDMVYSLALHWKLPVKDVDLDQALQILHGESQQWVAPAGYYWIHYKGQAISMIKQLGQRFNNLHPNEWRIRHLPK